MYLLIQPFFMHVFFALSFLFFYWVKIYRNRCDYQRHWTTREITQLTLQVTSNVMNISCSFLYFWFWAAVSTVINKLVATKSFGYLRRPYLCRIYHTALVYLRGRESCKGINLWRYEAQSIRGTHPIFWLCMQWNVILICIDLNRLRNPVWNIRFWAVLFNSSHGEVREICDFHAVTTLSRFSLISDRIQWL